MNIYYFSIALSIVFILVILDLVRRQRLKEQYSLLWIIVGVILLILSLNVALVERIAALLNVKYAPAMLFLFGLIFSFALILHMTVVISKMNDQLIRLSQEVAILKSETKENE